MKLYLVVLLSLVLLPSCRQEGPSVDDAKGIAEIPIMQQVSEKVRSLASSSEFSDNDAIESAMFLYEKLTGSKPEKDYVHAKIAESSPIAVSVFVWYGSGPHVTYEVRFARSGRTAYFESLRYIPSE